MENVKQEMIERFMSLYNYNFMLSKKHIKRASRMYPKLMEYVEHLLMGNYAYGYAKIDEIHEIDKYIEMVYDTIFSKQEDSMCALCDELYIYIANEQTSDAVKAMKLDIADQYIKMAKYVDDMPDYECGYYHNKKMENSITYNAKKYEELKKAKEHEETVMPIQVITEMKDVNFDDKDFALLRSTKIENVKVKKR